MRNTKLSRVNDEYSFDQDGSKNRQKLKIDNIPIQIAKTL